MPQEFLGGLKMLVDVLKSREAYNLILKFREQPDDSIGRNFNHWEETGDLLEGFYKGRLEPSRLMNDDVILKRDYPTATELEDRYTPKSWDLEPHYKPTSRKNNEKEDMHYGLVCEYYFDFGIETAERTVAYFNLWELEPRPEEKGKIRTLMLRVSTRGIATNGFYSLRDLAPNFTHNNYCSIQEAGEISTFLKDHIDKQKKQNQI